MQRHVRAPPGDWSSVANDFGAPSKRHPRQPPRCINKSQGRGCNSWHNGRDATSRRGVVGGRERDRLAPRRENCCSNGRTPESEFGDDCGPDGFCGYLQGEALENFLTSVDKCRINGGCLSEWSSLGWDESCLKELPPLCSLEDACGVGGGRMLPLPGKGRAETDGEAAEDADQSAVEDEGIGLEEAQDKAAATVELLLDALKPSRTAQSMEREAHPIRPTFPLMEERNIDGDDSGAFFSTDVFIGSWIDSEGSSIQVWYADAYDVRLLATLSRQYRPDVQLLIRPVAFGGGWQCGHSVLDPTWSSPQQLHWVAADGRLTVWVRPSGHSASEPEPDQREEGNEQEENSDALDDATTASSSRQETAAAASAPAEEKPSTKKKHGRRRKQKSQDCGADVSTEESSPQTDCT